MAGPEREDIRIPSHGEQLAAYLYRPPAAADNTACVVMAHGFSATRDDSLPAYAEAFRDAGYTVILFDYRHFGASTGQPRQLLDFGRQIEDYRAAVDWARQLSGVDPERIVLWGTSFSGGHVLAVAAEDPRIAAVIAQAPFVDGLPTLKGVTPKNFARLSVAGLRDQITALRGRPPFLLPAVGDPGDLAAMTAPDAKPGFEALVAPNSLWRNEFTPRLILTFASYRPGRKTAQISAPVMVCICENDSTTPTGPAIKAARSAPRSELRTYAYGHFDIYHDPQAKDDQLAFLRRVLAHH